MAYQAGEEAKAGANEIVVVEVVHDLRCVVEEGGLEARGD